MYEGSKVEIQAKKVMERSDEHLFDGSDDSIKALHHGSEHHVLTVQVGSRFQSDEKLRAV